MLQTSLLALIALFSGYGCYYFSILRPIRPATVTMALLTAFSSWETAFLFIAKVAVSTGNQEALARLLRSPLAILPGLLGLAGTGLLLVLIIRRETRAKG